MSNLIPKDYSSSSSGFQEEVYRRFEGTNSASSTVGQYINTYIPSATLFTYPFYIRIKYKCLSTTIGTFLGDSIYAATATRPLRMTSSTVYHPWGSFSFTSGTTNIHTLEIVSRNSTTYDIFIDGEHKATGTITAVSYSGSILIGGAAITTRTGDNIVCYRGNFNLYEAVFDYNGGHYHYVPAVRKSDNVYGLYRIENRYLYQGVDNAFNLQGTGTTNTYIPGFFGGKVGLGVIQTAVTLPGTCTNAEYASTWSSSSTSKTVKMQLAASPNPDFALFNPIRNAVEATVTSYSAATSGAYYIPGFSYWATSPYSETVTDITGTYTAWFLDVHLSKNSGTSVSSNEIVVTVNWSYVAPTTVKNADDFIYIGQGQELFAPARIPDISLKNSLYYELSVNNSVSPKESSLYIYNPTNLWLQAYIEVVITDSEGDYWYGSTDIWLGPGMHDEIFAESENNYTITFVEASVDLELDSLPSGNKYSDTYWDDIYWSE